MLTVLREQVLFFEQIYKSPDPDAKVHADKLTNTLATYLDTVKTRSDDALTWRMDMITLDHKRKTSWGILGPSKTDIYTFKDTYTGAKKTWQYNTLVGPKSDGGKEANAFFEQRKAQAKAKMQDELDVMTQASKMWKYLDPKEPSRPSRKLITTTSGPFAGRSGNSFTDNTHGQNITEIRLVSGTRIDGIEVKYGGVSGGAHGRKPEGHSLQLDDGEFIRYVSGRCGDAIDFLEFVTSKGRKLVRSLPKSNHGLTLYHVFH